jgi:hypothetical protein
MFQVRNRSNKNVTMILAINGLAEASGTAAGGGKINILDEKK